MQALYVWIAIIFGITLHRLLLAAGRLSGGPMTAQAAANLLLFAVLAQFGARLYNPGQFLPSPREKAARWALIDQIKAIPGDVYVVNHSWDAVLAGKQPHAEGEAVGAVVDAGGPQKNLMIEAVRQNMMDHKFGAIVVDGGYMDYKGWLTPEELAQYPVHVAASGSQSPRFLTSQPTVIMLPCSSLTDGVAARISIDGVAPSTPECQAPVR
jgi:hypothetical protein